MKSKTLPPPLNPQTMEPIGPEDLAPLFPMGLILQEVSQDSFIDIPKPVLDLYKLYRPSPLFRAVRLEKALGTKSRIYYKYEGGSPSGSHKPNTAPPPVPISLIIPSIKSFGVIASSISPTTIRNRSQR